MEKTAIYIDGGYLNRILKDQFNETDIDYNKLCEVICKKLEVERLRTYFYHCMPFVRRGNKSDKVRYAEMQKFVKKIKRLPRFEVKLGKLQFVGGKFKQKMVDILMSLDIADMCFENQIQQAILIAGDSDFIPAIKKAKNHGAIIHLFYHPTSVHDELLDEIDEAHIISKDLIDKCIKKK